MKVIFLRECGYEDALYGIGLNKKITSNWDKAEDMPMEITEKMQKVAIKLAKLDGGHNSFLELIQTWWTIEFPFEVWKQMDRYRMKSQTSASTMHTLMNYPIARSDFDDDVPDEWINYLESLRLNGNFDKCSALLPQCYLQKRLLNINYKTLRNIVVQRKNHKLPEWGIFVDAIYKNVKHPELLP